jgi:hypothetical protein
VLRLGGIEFQHSLEVVMVSSSCCSVGMHYGLVVDVSFGWQEVECAEEQDDMRVKSKASCSSPDGRGQVPELGPAPLPV